MELNLHKCVILIGFGGLLGSTPGLFEGIGFGNVCKRPFTLMQMEAGKLSSCSHEVSERKKMRHILIKDFYCFTKKIKSDFLGDLVLDQLLSM